MDGANADGPLDRPAARSTVFELHAAGCLSAEARDAALNRLRPPLAWWRWVDRALLFLGSALLLAGIVFFFAYNWAGMGAPLKFALVEGGLAACCLGAWRAGLAKITGQVLLLGASLLVGVLLTVYGQTYQTGADAYELFLAWSILILGWVAIANFGALWLMWLVLINVSLILYWVQVALPNAAASQDSLYVLLGLIDGAALAAREFGAMKRLPWLAARWLRWMLLAAVLSDLTIPTVLLIVSRRHRQAAAALSVLLLLGVLAGGYWFFRYRVRDLFALTLGALCVCALVLTLVGHALFETSNEAGMFLFFGLVVVGVFSAVAFWLRRTGRAMEMESGA